MCVIVNKIIDKNYNILFMHCIQRIFSLHDIQSTITYYIRTYILFTRRQVAVTVTIVVNNEPHYQDEIEFEKIRKKEIIIVIVIIVIEYTIYNLR